MVRWPADLTTSFLFRPMKLDVFALRRLEIRIILGSFTYVLAASVAIDSPGDLARFKNQA